MAWRKECLDLVLVPLGLMIMSGYHLYLLHRCVRSPETTGIGYENHYRKAWVERVLQVEGKDRGLYLTVITSTVTASTFLASTSLALSSKLSNRSMGGSSSHNIFISSVVYGDTSSSVITVKYIFLLICFLVAFASFLQCARSLVHANFLISMPNSDIPVSYVQKAVIRGSTFWSIGLRAIYFATNLLMWIFGPIPMFVTSLVMVVILNILDTNSTPLHQFQSAKSHCLFRRMREEVHLHLQQ